MLQLTLGNCKTGRMAEAVMTERLVALSHVSYCCALNKEMRFFFDFSVIYQYCVL